MSVVKSIADFTWNDRKLLVACSGGVDSMVLLHALLQAGHKPEVLHVNYQLRGEDSELDEKLVRETAEKSGLVCHVHRCPVSITKAKGVNLQSAARDFRRSLFEEWKAKSPRHAVVLGHHSDDQAETFFLQLFRGSGTFGLGAMYPDKDNLLRPFLEIPKDEILRYAAENGIIWREDSSNAQDNYLRNVFRNRLLPELKNNNPSLGESVNILASAFREHQKVIAEKTAPIAELWSESGKLSIRTWQQLASDEKVSLLRNMQFSAWLLDRLDELSGLPDSKILQTDSFRIIRSNGHFVLEYSAENESWDFKVEEIEILPQEFSNDILYLDGELIDPGLLRLELPKSGERIKSLGVNGSQLVSKVLKDAKIPETSRKSFPVLKYNDEAIWIPGLRIGRTHIAVKSSERLLKITVNRIK